MMVQGKEYLDLGDIIWEFEDNDNYIILKKWIVKKIYVKGCERDEDLNIIVTYTCHFDDCEKFSPRDIGHHELINSQKYFISKSMLIRAIYKNC